jgi:hypothetical protein
MVRAVTCPLCGQRKARRDCPAIGQRICAVCCGTKRLTEIACPPDCVYLASARVHPPAAYLRQRYRDLGLLVDVMRDLNERQAQLFLFAATLLLQYDPPALQPLIDDDVIEAAAALAATYDTAAKGLIYEHRPPSLPAERLVQTLKPRLAEAGTRGGSAFERDVAVVFRQIGEAASRVRQLEPENRRAFLDLLRREVRTAPEQKDTQSASTDQPRLIVP